MINREKLRFDLIRAEGVRLNPYQDTVGKVTIGVGRNLDDAGLSYTEAMILLENDIDKVLTLAADIPHFSHLNEVRKRVIVEMIFNLGYAGVHKFKNMWQAIEKSDWDKAANDMLDSLWAKQVGERAKRLATCMRSGEDKYP